jgi:N-acyl-D-amino-acid deacylase
MSDYDLIIRNGTVVDGSGGPSQRADVAISGDRIAAIAPSIASRAKAEIDASGHLVTPGFIDVHTHYDGQATWDRQMAPSSQLGTTTVVMGNCGVGFAPCRRSDHDTLIGLMEGVEDIPGTALAEGLTWDWESFVDFLDVLERKPRDIDIAALFPHSPLRVFVMGERAVEREAATADDIARMKQLLAEGLDAGAMGFSTSRTRAHRTVHGDLIPSYGSQASEVEQIADAFKGRSGKVFQLVSDFTDGEADFDILRNVCRNTGGRGTFTLMQQDYLPDLWHQQLSRVSSAQQQGLDIRAQVLSRPLGLIMGLNASLVPFYTRPSFIALQHLPLAERVAQLSRPEVKARILGESDGKVVPLIVTLRRQQQDIFPLESRDIDYMPPTDRSVAARAARAGVSAEEWLYDYLLTDGGNSLVYVPLVNFTESILDMLQHPHTVPALGDGGAHVATICDASAGIYLLTNWVRKRQLISLEQGIHLLTRRPADLYSLADRGLLAPGMKADINILDFDTLQLDAPRIVADLPAGGKRFLQNARGLIATIVAGQTIYRDNRATGILPGRLVRGAQSKRAA